MMRNLFAFLMLVIFIFLSGCTLVRKMDIEQGNLMTCDRVNALHPGMTRAQVKDIMGSPMLLNTFNDNRVDYVYTFKCGYKCMTEKAVILTFRGNVLVKIDRPF